MLVALETRESPVDRQVKANASNAINLVLRQTRPQFGRFETVAIPFALFADPVVKALASRILICARNVKVAVFFLPLDEAGEHELPGLVAFRGLCFGLFRHDAEEDRYRVACKA